MIDLYTTILDKERGNYLTSNTPLQIVTIPISLTCFWCFKGFANTLAVCSGSRQLFIVIVPFCMRFQTQCHWVAKCFDRLWNWGLRAIMINPSLSPFSGFGDFENIRVLHINYEASCQHASPPASERAMYSTSVDDRAIVVCFFDLHIIAPCKQFNL